MILNRLKQWLLVVGVITAASVTTNIILIAKLVDSQQEQRRWQGRYDQLVQRIPDETTQQTATPIPTKQPSHLAAQLQRPLHTPRRDSPAPLTDTPDEPEPREVFDVSLAMLIDERLPDLDLSEEGLAELAETVAAIREAVTVTRELKRSTANAEAFRSYQMQLNESMEKLENITGMDLITLMRHVDPDGGIDHDTPDDETVVTEYLRDFQP